jgi:voltage-dependent potassium channel beta subunit
MEYRFLGHSGLKVSELSYGTWVTFCDQIGEDEAYPCLTAAWDAGVNFFDTAEVYSRGRAETLLGHLLRKAGWKRSDLVIATKIFWGGPGPNDKGLSRKHIIEGMNASLERLQMDYVDLVFCHRPDKDTPVEETVRAMTHLITTGRAMYWGTSEWSATRIMEAWAVARREHLIPPTMEQPEYHMFHRERVESEYRDLYARIGLGTTIWSPLAGGLLTGKYAKGVPEGTRPTVRGYTWLRKRFEGAAAADILARTGKLAKLAADLGITTAQLALAWCLKNPNVSTVITGASRAEQVVENMKAAEAVKKLKPAVMERIEEILGNRPAPEPDYKA